MSGPPAAATNQSSSRGLLGEGDGAGCHCLNDVGGFSVSCKFGLFGVFRMGFCKHGSFVAVVAMNFLIREKDDFDDYKIYVFKVKTLSG